MLFEPDFRKVKEIYELPLDRYWSGWLKPSKGKLKTFSECKCQILVSWLDLEKMLRVLQFWKMKKNCPKNFLFWGCERVQWGWEVESFEISIQNPLLNLHTKFQPLNSIWMGDEDGTAFFQGHKLKKKKLNFFPPYWSGEGWLIFGSYSTFDSLSISLQTNNFRNFYSSAFPPRN